MTNNKAVRISESTDKGLKSLSHRLFSLNIIGESWESYDTVISKAIDLSSGVLDELEILRKR